MKYHGIIERVIDVKAGLAAVRDENRFSAIGLITVALAINHGIFSKR
jgi:hypothetical protein